MCKILVILLFSIPSIAIAQLDIKSVSFNRVVEIPGEKHLGDSMEYNLLLVTIEKSHDPDSAFLYQGLDCLWSVTHDTSYRDYWPYSLDENIHIGDFNGDKKNDFIIDFAIWGCTAYFNKAYLSKKDSYEILNFGSGFLGKIELENHSIKSVQNIRYDSPMYGFHFINKYIMEGNKVKFKYTLEYLYDSDSIMQTELSNKHFLLTSDSIELFHNEGKFEIPENERHKYHYALKNRKILILITEKDWCLIIAEIKNDGFYEEGRLIPENYFISAWIKKEDLK